MAGQTTILQPDVTFTLRGDVQTVGNTAHRVLALGQMLCSTGTAVAGELQEQIGNDNSQNTLFGTRSMLAATIDAFKGTLSAPLNRVTRIDAIGLLDGGTPEALAISIGNLISTGLIANVLVVAHGHQTGDCVVILGADQAEYNVVSVPITRIDADNFTYLFAGSATSPATGTITANFVNPIQATGKVTFTGGPVTTGATSGSVFVDIGSSRNHRYEVAFSAGDTITELGDALVTVEGLDLKSQADAVNTVGDVEFTAVHGGPVGDSIGIRVTGTIPGVDISVSAFSGGTTNPTLTTLFDVIVDERYQTILYPSEWGFTTITDFLDPRFNVNGQVLDGLAISALVDTFTNLQTAGNAENSESLVIDGNALVADALYKGPSIFELTYETIGYNGAERALRLTEGANISQFVIGGGTLDSTGGVHISSKPYFNTPFPLSPVIPTGKGFSQTQIESLLTAGISVRGNNISANSIIWGEVVTTYKTDAAGNPDTSFKFLNAVDTGTAIREFFFNNTRASFSQSRLTDGDLIPRVASANQGSIEAFLTGLFAQLSAPEFSLTRSGEANLLIFTSNLVVVLDLSAGSVSADLVVPIVVQFREFNGTINIKF